MSGPGIGAAGDRGGRSIPDAVSLADVAPTAMRLLGFSMSDVDGIDVRPAFAGAALGRRELYAESFAPFVEFGWAPLRSVRSGAWKYIAAPESELYDLEHDAGEQQNVEPIKPEVAEGLATRQRYSSDTLERPPARRTGAAARLRALGYSGSSPRNTATAHLLIRSAGKELAADRAGDLRWLSGDAPLVRATASSAKTRATPRPAAITRPPGTRRLREGRTGLSRGQRRRPAVRRRVPGTRRLPRPTGRSGSRRRGVDRGTADRAGQSDRGGQPRSPQGQQGRRGRGD